MLNAHNTGKVIAFLRRYYGWTQAELARKLNVTGKTVSKWENGGGYPDVTLIPLLAETFGVSIDFLMNSGENIDVGALRRTLRSMVSSTTVRFR